MIRERKYNSRPTVPAPPRPHEPRLFALALCLVCAVVVLCGARLSPTSAAQSAAAPPPQRRTPAGRQRPRTSPNRPPGIDYTKFSHATKGHYEDCASCHVTDTTPKFTLAKPDIKEYPDHQACIECHRAQFFRGPVRGTAPAICADCHVAATPRNGARFVFPKPQQPSQFADMFPHSNHAKFTALGQFARELKKEKVKQQDTCFYCHKLDTDEHKAIIPGSKTAFDAKPGTFMSTPTTHANCFQCHWQKGVEGREQEPLANECARCHENRTIAARPPAVAPSPAASPAKAAATPTPRSAATPAAKPTATPTKPKLDQDFAHSSMLPAAFVLPISFIPAASLQAQPQAWSQRTSPQFRHVLYPDGKPQEDPHQYRGEKKDDKVEQVKLTCLTCHTSVKKSESLTTLRQPMNKVQLLTCATTACHAALTTGDKFWSKSIYNELKERVSNQKYDCALCHLAPISTRPEVPCDHYEVVYKTAVDGKKPKAAEAIKALTPQPRCNDVLK